MSSWRWKRTHALGDGPLHAVTLASALPVGQRERREHEGADRPPLAPKTLAIADTMAASQRGSARARRWAYD